MLGTRNIHNGDHVFYVILNKLRGIKVKQKNLASPCKVFPKGSTTDHTTTFETSSSNTRNKTEDTTQGIIQRNSQGIWDQRTMVQSWDRETVGSPVVQQNEETGFKKLQRDFATMPKESRSQSSLKTTIKIDEQEIGTHYSSMAKIQEVYQKKPVQLNTITESECANEAKANTSLTQELEECKTNLDETSRALGEATSCRDSCLIALQNKQTELEKYKAINDRTY
ncbi:hypothetical protein Tco_0067527 [Tanacetum coccineum]